jgi:hypothetical protein
MKRVLLIILLISFSFISCRKERTSLIPAVITGFDERKCMCCGGLMISPKNNPAPYAEPFYLVANNPSEFGITDQSQFPIYIEIDWKVDTSGCPGKIRITKFRRR